MEFDRFLRNAKPLCYFFRVQSIADQPQDLYLSLRQRRQRLFPLVRSRWLHCVVQITAFRREYQARTG